MTSKYMHGIWYEETATQTHCAAASQNVELLDCIKMRELKGSVPLIGSPHSQDTLSL